MLSRVQYVEHFVCVSVVYDLIGLTINIGGVRLHCRRGNWRLDTDCHCRQTRATAIYAGNVRVRDGGHSGSDCLSQHWHVFGWPSTGRDGCWVSLIIPALDYQNLDGLYEVADNTVYTEASSLLCQSTSAKSPHLNIVASLAGFPDAASVLVP